MNWLFLQISRRWLRFREGIKLGCDIMRNVRSHGPCAAGRAADEGELRTRTRARFASRDDSALRVEDEQRAKLAVRCARQTDSLRFSVGMTINAPTRCPSAARSDLDRESTVNGRSSGWEYCSNHTALLRATRRGSFDARDALPCSPLIRWIADFDTFAQFMILINQCKRRLLWE